MMGFKQELADALAHGGGEEVLHALAVRFRDAGGQQEEAAMAVRQLFSETKDESQLELLMELEDVVIGHCHPEYRLWPTIYYTQSQRDYLMKKFGKDL